MKRFICLSLLLISCILIAQSQSDTTFYYKNIKVIVNENSDETQVKVVTSATDSAENLIFEAIQSDDFNASKNFRLSKKLYDNNEMILSLGGGMFFGFSNLASRDLQISTVPGACLRFSSYELGLNFVKVGVHLSRMRNWNIVSGLGFRVQQFNSDNNTAFDLIGNNTVQLPAPENIFYSTSKLTCWYLNVPFMVDWRLKRKDNSFYIQFGFEFGVRMTSKSKIMYRDNGEKTKSRLGEGDMNVNPLTADGKFEIGIGSLGLYVRYGLVPLFRSGRGPSSEPVVPVGAGVVWNF